MLHTRSAGDQYLDFALSQIEKARTQLPDVAAAAEIAADRLVLRNGRLLVAGDEGFGGESVWRSGGIAFSKRYVSATEEIAAPTKDEASEAPYYRTDDYEQHYKGGHATSDDVVLVGYENELEERSHLADHLKEVLPAGALVVLFGSKETAHAARKEFSAKDNLISLSHDVPDGGIVQISGWPERVCSGRSFVNRLYLWLFEAELIAALMRRGKIPGILLSVTYESPQVFNLALIHAYRFIPAFNVVPVKAGEFGNTYLDCLKAIANSIFSNQREQFQEAARWLAQTIESKHKVFALLIGWPNPTGLPGDPDLFDVTIEASGDYPSLQNMTHDDVVLYIGYNWYPVDLADVVDEHGAKLIVCMTLVKDMPPQTAHYRTPLLHVTSLEELPKRPDHLYIDVKFAQYDAILTIPGYPFPAIPTSWMADSLAYWYLVANTVEILGAKDTVSVTTRR
jgi:uncharacterized phosphosugar-binding protein